ncbi:MAG: formylglycine-generating enzyme family protein, partial [Actinomycetota bacterium]|nr:formylglycine-generating enzyme family protein [Actinomycetota bacterium]
NQAALDTSLGQSSPDVHARFALLIAGSTTPASEPEEHTASAACDQVRHPVDGKPMTLVDAGVFIFGQESQPVWLPAFYIDIYPTTNADYARFVAATGHRTPMHWVEGACQDNLLDHPVVFVSWRDAHAYAEWAGKALPSNQQWEKVARGTRGDTYPWGNQPTPAKCNVRESGVGSTTPGDRYRSGVSSYGVYDMCGNIWEWCATETDPDRRELKGGAFTSPFDRATPSAFNDASADMYDDDTGFRCVTPDETLKVLLRRR